MAWREPGLPEVQHLNTAWTNTTTSYTTVTGLTFTPDAGGVYAFEYQLAATSADTNGLRVQISPGNVASGMADMRVRGASATTAVVYNGPISAALTVGTNAPATPGDKFSASGSGTFVAHASAPTAFSVQAACQIANSVAVAANDGWLRIRRLA